MRVEVGPRELAEGKVTLTRRDTNVKQPAEVAAAVSTVQSLLDEIQMSLLIVAQ